jgi:hypothetical protein
MATKPWLEEADNALLRQPGQTGRGPGGAMLSASGRRIPALPLLGLL